MDVIALNIELVHEFAYVIFIDPTYKQGWIERKELPKEKDAIHIGIGIVVQQNEKAYWFAFAEELYDITSDVMHPQMIHKDCIIKLYKFTEDLFVEIFKPKISKKIKDLIVKEIDYEIEDYM